MQTGALLACRNCDTIHAAAVIEPGGMATCSCCGYVLLRRSRFSLRFWHAFTLTALVVFLIANLFPLARLSMLGKSLDATFVGALWLTWQQGHHALSIMTGLTGFWFPLTQICFLFWALGCLRKGRLPPDFALAMRIYHLALPWSMVPVLMLGIIVAIVKFSDLAALIPGAGLWAFGVLTFMLTALSRLDSRRLWHYAEDAGLAPATRSTTRAPEDLTGCEVCGHVQEVVPQADETCERCGSLLHKRKPDMGARVWALLIAATAAYIPANVLPMMEIRSTMGASAHTILGGVIELWQLGSWDLAVIVFVASVVVPITKLIALAVLMLGRRWRGWRVQRQRTRLYEMLEFIGQWSMLDVFVVILMTAMANFPGLSQIIAGPAAASFGLVVVLTMLAAMSYDPRIGWDRGRRAASEH
ncbi:paraquat-inducible membrane protein A [bacterium SGD-2]|nr:paraquat-inducible membrane protein A [bacterium SGD-2]